MHRQLCSLKFLSLLLAIPAVVRPQPFPYISIGGVILPNDAFVELSDVESTVDDSLQCHTDLPSCCSGGQGIHRGDWYFPNGTRLYFYGGISQSRGAQQVSLRRMNSVSDVESGIFRCDISVHSDVDISTRDSVYVGIYSTGGGTLLI